MATVMATVMAQLCFVLTITSHLVKRESIHFELARFWMLLDRSYRWTLWSINCSIPQYRFSQSGKTKKIGTYVHATRQRSRGKYFPLFLFRFLLFSVTSMWFILCIDTSVLKRRAHADPIFNMWWGLTRKQTGHEEKSTLKIILKKVGNPEDYIYIYIYCREWYDLKDISYNVTVHTLKTLRKLDFKGVKVIPLKSFYYQTFFETWRN